MIHNTQARALSAAELQTYLTDGLVRPACRLSAQWRQRLLQMADVTLAATPGQRPESINCPHIPDWTGLPAALSEQWMQVAGLPEIVDRVADILGDDIILWGAQFFCKPAQTGLEVPWHQDGDYWPIRPLATCTVWLAIDDANAENGCMRVIPGSHAQRRIFKHYVDHRPDLVLNQVTDAASFDERMAVDDLLQSGCFSIHDVFLIHGSAPNTSGKRRAALVLRYMPATSLYDRGTALDGGTQHYQTRFPIRPIYLMRGQAHANVGELIERHPDYRAHG